MLNNNYSDYSLVFCVRSSSVISRSLGKPTSGNERFGLSGPFGKNNIQFPTNGANAISNAGTFFTISAATAWFGSQYIYITHYSLKAETGKKLSASAFNRYPSSICIIYIILLLNGSYIRNEVSTSKNVSKVVART